MFYSPEELKQRATIYCKNHDLELIKSLGHGTQGMVFSTNRESAVKVHAQEAAYTREREAYLRLKDQNASDAHGLIIPRLYSFDDASLIIEMSLVSPPFVVDFGGAYLDRLPPHLENPIIREQWLSEKLEQFGKNWPEAEKVLIEFEMRYGIYIADVNPGNIQFGNQN